MTPYRNHYAALAHSNDLHAQMLRAEIEAYELSPNETTESVEAAKSWREELAAHYDAKAAEYRAYAKGAEETCAQAGVPLDGLGIGYVAPAALA